MSAQPLVPILERQRGLGLLTQHTRTTPARLLLQLAVLSLSRRASPGVLPAVLATIKPKKGPWVQFTAGQWAATEPWSCGWHSKWGLALDVVRSESKYRNLAGDLSPALRWAAWAPVAPGEVLRLPSSMLWALESPTRGLGGGREGG